MIIRLYYIATLLLIQPIIYCSCFCIGICTYKVIPPEKISFYAPVENLQNIHQFILNSTTHEEIADLNSYSDLIPFTSEDKVINAYTHLIGKVKGVPYKQIIFATGLLAEATEYENEFGVLIGFGENGACIKVKQSGSISEISEVVEPSGCAQYFSEKFF